ncbi:cysteine--tRNA ligase [Rhodopseudomonas palustris]|uniref:cysteine--tRNA ligase n=1 Tax=Rhodopseudomonas palustris TaxID=1076 RepID=UPI000CECA069|nr:cysteine--tRNA ligase [Rhodopseudomonas palustris]PPQ41080.1 cysteine--tRNA ligase [Rhodopseudomonas palustris]
MELRLYDTLTRDKRPFTPIDPANVRMYVCGPTVYDFAHIGNARPVIVFDVLFRLLRHLYGEAHVKYVRNITDVDDKINDRAARDYPGLPLNEAIRKVTEQTERQFHDDVDALGCLRPTVEPRATEHIGEMRSIIEKLVAGGFAYVEQDHVLFSPSAMNAANGVLPRYGSLANRSLDEMIAGARVDVAPYKRDATDFVLWKPSKPGEPSWPSPAGIATPGRPGWHIECSAMSWKHLGETFDIHGGGIDLVFPHHENEVAQSCCAFHTERMAQTWMHNGFLQVEGEKMSKSLGNFITIRELLATNKFGGRSWDGATLRLAMLKTHYRQPIDWTVDALEEAQKRVAKYRRTLERFGGGKNVEVPHGVVSALSDDLNTHAAITELDALNRRANGVTHEGPTSEADALAANAIAADELRASLRLLGISVASERSGAVNQIFDQNIQRLIAARTAARANKDWKESDRIRDELAAMGVVLKDGKDADGKPVTTWELAR